jgi:hypothetical protein
MDTFSKKLRYLKLACIVVFCLVAITSCSNGDGGDSIPQLSYHFTEAPIDLTGITADFSADVAYGDAENNIFDIYLPDSYEPTPLVIFIHGGGFTGGDKSSSHEDRAEEIREFLQDGIAYATVNYRLLTVDPVDEDGVIKSMLDCARVLQFIRYYSDSLNIDPENVALYGASAGAGTSLWLGTHDDLADPENEDPVLRESTRVKAVGALATQSTYDIIRWEEILLPVLEPFKVSLGGTDILTVATAVGAADYLLAFLGIPSVDVLETPEVLEYRANVDMLALMDEGDAPIYVRNFATGFDDLLNTFLHHGLHALAVKTQADEVGLHSVGYVEDPAYALEDPSGEGLVSFLSRHIQ